MADPGILLLEAIDALAGVEATWIVGGDPPSFEETLEDYSNAEIADAAGRPKARPHTPAWMARRTLMRDLQRWRRGKHQPSRRLREIVEEAGLERRRRETTPEDPAAVARLLRRHGLTVTLLAGVLIVSQDVSWREVRNVFCAPSALAAGGFHRELDLAVRLDNPDQWLRAFEDLFEVWRSSYGVAGFALDELEILELAIGRQPEQAHGRRVRGAA